MSAPGRAGRRLSGRWLAAGGGLVLATVVGVAVVMQTTSGAACAAGPAAAVPGLAAGVVAPGLAAGVAPPVGGTAHRGKASYYSTSGGGNCSNPKPPADGLFVALGPSEYADAAACGGYLDVTGPKGKVRVLIFDKCPGCPVGQIDLSKQAFARIADPAAGMVSVTYRAAVDPVLSRSIALRFKEGTSQYWFAMMVTDHGNPLRTMEVRSAGGSWKRVSRTDYNYWVADDGLGPGPFDIRLTDVYGNRVIAPRVRLSPGRTQRPGVSLYGRTARRQPTATPTPAPTPSVSRSPSAVASVPTGGAPTPTGPVTPTPTPSRDDC